MSLISDLRWALLMLRAKRIRRKLSFGSRHDFDRAIRPVMTGDAVIDYPDAIYHIKAHDLSRAVSKRK